MTATDLEAYLERFPMPSWDAGFDWNLVTESELQAAIAELLGKHGKFPVSPSGLDTGNGLYVEGSNDFATIPLWKRSSMVAGVEVTTYRDGNMYWAEASGPLQVTPECAWKSLERLLMRIIEMPSCGGSSMRLVRTKKNVPLTHLGNELIAKAAMLQGIIKASMSMKVTESVEKSYLRLDVRTYNLSFAVIDFRIKSMDGGCKLIFRQGFRSRRHVSPSSENQAESTSREMPETARILNMWADFAEAAAQQESFLQAPLPGARSG